MGECRVPLQRSGGEFFWWSMTTSRQQEGLPGGWSEAKPNSFALILGYCWGFGVGAGRDKCLTFLCADIKLQSCCPLVSQQQKAHIVRELLPNQRGWCHTSEIFLTLSILWPSNRKNAEMIPLIRGMESTIVTAIRLTPYFLLKKFMTSTANTLDFTHLQNI